MKNPWNNLRCLIANQHNKLTIDPALTKLFNKIKRIVNMLVDNLRVFKED